MEISILAFALRQLRKLNRTTLGVDTRESIRLLGRKLKVYRKRGKRIAISSHGKQAYDDAVAVWRRFADWAHYNLLFEKIPTRGAVHIRLSWRSKYAQMAELIKATVTERYDQALTDDQMIRIRQFIVPSLRRGRHELTLNTVLSGSDKAKDFLIAFITKRLELRKGPGAPLTHWEKYWAKTDAFAEMAHTRAFSYRTPADHIRPAGRRAGVTKHLMWKMFRTSVATQLNANGENIKTAQQTLGHANSRLTADVYTVAVA